MKSRKNIEVIEYSSGNMVSIDEILKDDPKALKELAELRKWMDGNPINFDFPKEKQTQGQKKMKQLLEDARRNTGFIKQLKKVSDSKSAYDHEDIQPLYAIYRIFLAGLHSFRKKHLLKNSAHKLKRKLCKEYGIDPILFDRLILAYKNNRLEGWDFSEEAASDTCVLESPEYAEQPVDAHSFHLGMLDGIEKEIYPAHIKIHRFATKRDILDFVEKNWSSISSFLSKKRIKQRKLSREVVDFMWKHRDKKAKGILLLLREKYPKERLYYFEINRILNEEKKRRKIE